MFFEIILPDLQIGAKRAKGGKNVAKMWQGICIFNFAHLGSLLVDHKMHNCQVGRECVLGAARGASVTFFRPKCIKSAETSTSTDLERF